MNSVVQEWVSELTFQQQTVLLSAIRGPDGIKKVHPAKDLLRWYRRCILLNSFTGGIMTDPVQEGGGTFMGPSECAKTGVVDLEEYIKTVDELPYHFQLHLVHAVEVLGYKHPDESIRLNWHCIYIQMVENLHMMPEEEKQLDARLRW